MSSNKYYAVWQGKVPGIYSSWEECREQVDRFPGARYKKLNATTWEQAQQEYAAQNPMRANADLAADAMALGSGRPTAERFLTVDGAANGVCCEFQAVWSDNSEQAFASKQFEGGTNNIAEFLGLVSALKYLKDRNLPLVVYTDSITAMTWVKNKKAQTTAGATGKLTAELAQLISQAEKYLVINSQWISKAQILKWDTRNWGEIPADYGRKAKSRAYK